MPGCASCGTPASCATGPDGGRAIPDKASPDGLARARKTVLGQAFSMPTPAATLPTGNASRAPAREPHPISAGQSDPARREVRSRGELCQALGAATRAIAGKPDPRHGARRRSNCKAPV
jgi:hypothetical protein